MSVVTDQMEKTGLQFFGMMMASISHEIKNVLAIINENAGLIKDLTHIAKQGAPLNIERIDTLADRFGKQVVRADRIIQNMNRLSHSIDEPVKQVDACEILELTVSLSNRFASMRSVAIDLLLPDSPVTMTTSPFFLNNLLWFCLDYAMDVAGAEKVVKINCQKDTSGISVHFTELHNLVEMPEKPLFSEQGKAVLNFLNAELKIDEKKHSVAIILPSRLDRSSGL